MSCPGDSHICANKGHFRRATGTVTMANQTHISCESSILHYKRLIMIKHCLRLLIFCVMVPAQLAVAAPVIIPAAPTLNAEAYLLMDAETGEVLVEHNIDMPVPPASLTKMMTGYIVTEEIARGKLKEEDQVRISDDAWTRGGTKSGGSTMFLDPRTNVSVIDLLRGVIIQSGNDASIALAQHLAGSETAFADMMNQYALHLGMNNTHFVNSTGWPAEGHITTARDMARLAKAVIKDHPEYYPIYAEKYFTYNGINQANRNRLLFRDATVDGLKTGHTEEAGFCLVASAQRQGMRLISVVMGTKSEEARAVESQKLFAYGFRYYQTHPLYSKGQELSRHRVWKGEAEDIGLGLPRDVTITIPRGASDNLKAQISVDSLIVAPIEQGQVLGELHVTLEDDQVFTSELVALESVTEAGFFARVWDSLKMFINNLFEK